MCVMYVRYCCCAERSMHEPRELNDNHIPVRRSTHCALCDPQSLQLQLIRALRHGLRYGPTLRVRIRAPRDMRPLLSLPIRMRPRWMTLCRRRPIPPLILRRRPSTLRVLLLLLLHNLVLDACRSQRKIAFRSSHLLRLGRLLAVHRHHAVEIALWLRRNRIEEPSRARVRVHESAWAWNWVHAWARDGEHNRATRIWVHRRTRRRVQVWIARPDRRSRRHSDTRRKRRQLCCGHVWVPWWHLLLLLMLLLLFRWFVHVRRARRRRLDAAPLQRVTVGGRWGRRCHGHSLCQRRGRYWIMRVWIAVHHRHLFSLVSLHRSEGG